MNQYFGTVVRVAWRGSASRQSLKAQWAGRMTLLAPIGYSVRNIHAMSSQILTTSAIGVTQMNSSAGPPGRISSSTSRTFRARTAGEKGFSKKFTSPSNTPWRTTASSV